jgi:hypothetical protein
MRSIGDLLVAAVEVSRLCHERGYHFCFIGGLAVQRWGNPRFTANIDLTLITGFGGEEQYIDALLEVLDPRRPDARQFALVHRVLLAREKRGGVDVDIALGGQKQLDWTVIREELPPLLEVKESPENLQRLEGLAAEALRRRSK